MNTETHTIVDATVRKYLTDKVRERFGSDYQLLEPMMEQLVSRYSLKELYLICSIEVERLKRDMNRAAGDPLRT